MVGDKVRVMGGMFDGRVGLLLGYSPDGLTGTVEMVSSDGRRYQCPVPKNCIYPA